MKSPGEKRGEGSFKIETKVIKYWVHEGHKIKKTNSFLFNSTMYCLKHNEFTSKEDNYV